MIAFRYISGTLTACDDYGPRLCVMGAQPWVDASTLEREELGRRVDAVFRNMRSHGILPISDALPPVEPVVVRDGSAVGSHLLDGHVFRSPAGLDVLLYLPAGEKPTEQHAADLECAPSHPRTTMGTRKVRCSACGKRRRYEGLPPQKLTGPPCERCVERASPPLPTPTTSPPSLSTTSTRPTS